MTAQTPRIICVGNSTLDRVWSVMQLPTAGSKYRASNYLEVGGGMAANAAVAIAHLGGSVAFWGRGGNDTAGHTMQQEMAGYGVDISHFRLFANAKSSISAILVAHDGERLIVNYRGEGIPDESTWLPLEKVEGSAAVHADIRWIEGASALFTQARALGIPTVLDGEIATSSAFTSVLPLTDHAIFSEPGLRSFCGNPTLAEADYAATLATVRKLGCRVAAVTLGAKGIYWLDGSGLHQQTAFSVEVVDTTGAGDVFHGAYALALGEGQPVDAAMRFASAVAALKCTRAGGRAGIPTRAEVNAFLTQRQ